MSRGQQIDVEGTRREGGGRAVPRTDAARKRAAVELIARHEASLKRTARRFSLDTEDAEDAFQRALEIVLTKAPTTDPRELIRWTQTVVRHEALAVRRSRERLLGRPPVADGAPDPIALLPASADGPDEQAERREEVARGREALRALKPAELRALTLLAEGYSYTEIGAMTGFSQTKVNRLLSEGRARFRSVLSGSRDGSRCRRLQPLLSAFCDGEASEADAETVREHLRACSGCRSTLRAYRTAPRIVAGLAPLLPPGRSLLGRLHETLAELASRLPGVGSDTAATQVAAAGGSGGAGLAGFAKLLAVCVGTAGGAAACVAAGVLPAPPGVGIDPVQAPKIERIGPAIVESHRGEEVAGQSAPPRKAAAESKPAAEVVEPETPAPEPAPAESVEYEAPPPEPPAPAPVETAGTSEAGSAAGEFGP